MGSRGRETCFKAEGPAKMGGHSANWRKNLSARPPIHNIPVDGRTILRDGRAAGRALHAMLTLGKRMIP